MKNFVHPVTAKKIVVLKSGEVYSTLNEHIDHDNIPALLGGGLEFKNGMLPDLCPAIQKTLQWCQASLRALPAGPIKWREHGNCWVAVGTGTVDGLQRTVEVASLVGLPTHSLVADSL